MTLYELDHHLNPRSSMGALLFILITYSVLSRWAAIAVTTILIRGATLPFLINQLKATYKLNVSVEKIC